MQCSLANCRDLIRPAQAFSVKLLPLLNRKLARGKPQPRASITQPPASTGLAVDSLLAQGETNRKKTLPCAWSTGTLTGLVLPPG